jgi:SET domain-containing protein
MKKIKVMKSSISGNGLFADENIKRNEFIGYIKGSIHIKNNKNQTDSVAYPDWVGFKKNAWIDPLPPFKYLNHSCEPNCGIRGTKTVVAMRDIKKNEELTLDYAITEVDPAWYIICTCGNKSCRKKITAIQTLSKARFLKYIPNIPTSFMNYYKANFLK